jgi:hypothetical protein
MGLLLLVFIDVAVFSAAGVAAVGEGVAGELQKGRELLTFRNILFAHL